MRISELDPSDFSQRLTGDGIVIETGPFTFRLRSRLPGLGDAIRLLYEDFPLGDASQVDFCLVAQTRRRILPLAGLAEVFVDGRRIFAPFPSGAALPNIEWALNWWIYNFAHQYLLIHAGTVAKAGQALLLSGVPGSGKSTLGAAMVASGWRLLSDELAVVEPQSLRLQATARPIALKNESIDIIATGFPNAVLGPRAPDTVKGTIAHLKTPRASVDQRASAALPRWVCFPRYDASARTQLEEVPKARAFMELAENAFNYRFAGVTGFQTLSALVDRCDCYRLVFSSLTEALAQISVICGSDACEAG